MNQKESTEIIIDYLKPIFLERGYKYKKNRWFGFVKPSENGFEHFVLTFSNYWPIQHPDFLVKKRFNRVENIYDKLVDIFGLNRTDVREINESFWFNYESLHFAHTNSYLKGGETEQEMLADAKRIEDFMLDVGFPMLDIYDLKTIDAEINGNDFWETDWQKKFSLGEGFSFKRLIIAKLCQNLRFEALYNYHLDKSEELRLQNPETLIKKVEGKTTFQYLVEVLLKDVDAI